MTTLSDYIVQVQRALGHYELITHHLYRQIESMGLMGLSIEEAVAVVKGQLSLSDIDTTVDKS